VKSELNAANRYRLIENQSDLLIAALSRPPALSAIRKSRFDGEKRIFRSHFDSRDLGQIEPSELKFPGRHRKASVQYPLSHLAPLSPTATPMPNEESHAL
jgi:hypothetical protein